MIEQVKNMLDNFIIPGAIELGIGQTEYVLEDIEPKTKCLQGKYVWVCSSNASLCIKNFDISPLRNIPFFRDDKSMG